MDPHFFGLSGDPFAKPENPEAPDRSDERVGLTAELHAGLKAPHGITLLIGDSGAGKSAFINEFLGQLSETYVTAYLPTAGPGLRHLLTETIEQLGGTVTQGAQEEALIDTVRSLAKARAEHDRSTLIVVDEAHDLPAKTIERLGKLFGTDPAEPTRLHLTLVGRAELLDRMNAANDRSILKHLVQVCRMDPMGPEEAFRYIADRVQKVGGIVDRLFTQDALKLVVTQANGNPARIDALCAAAMDRAARKGRTAVDAESVSDKEIGASAAAGEIVNNEKEPDTPTYFFHEESDHDAAVPAATDGGAAAEPAQKISQPEAVKPSAGGSRRRLIFWALGAAAVLAAFAATMTEGPTAPPIPVAGQKAKLAAKSGPEGGNGASATERKVANKGDKLAKQKADAPAKAASGGPDGSVPKLVAKRALAGAAASGVAATAGEAGAASDNAAAERNRFPAPVIPPTPAVPATGAASAGSIAEQAGDAFPTSVPPPPAAPPAAAPTATRPTHAATPPTAPMKAPALSTAVAPNSAPTPPAATKPAVAAPAPIAPTRAPTQAAPPAPKVLAPPTAVASATPGASAGARYTVQIGAFSSRANAEAVLAKARGTAKDGRILASSAGGKALFRVVAGSFSTQAEANSQAAALRANGYPSFVRKLD